MIESQRSLDVIALDDEPTRVGSISAGCEIQVVRWNQCKIHMRRRPASGITYPAAPTSELLEIGCLDASFVAKFAQRTGGKVVVLGQIDEAARERPLARKGIAELVPPLHKEYLERRVPNCEDHDVDGTQGSLERKCLIYHEDLRGWTGNVVPN